MTLNCWPVQHRRKLIALKNSNISNERIGIISISHFSSPISSSRAGRSPVCRQHFPPAYSLALFHASHGPHVTLAAFRHEFRRDISGAGRRQSCDGAPSMQRSGYRASISPIKRGDGHRHRDGPRQYILYTCHSYLSCMICQHR